MDVILGFFPTTKATVINSFLSLKKFDLIVSDAGVPVHFFSFLILCYMTYEIFPAIISSLSGTFAMGTAERPLGDLISRSPGSTTVRWNIRNRSSESTSPKTKQKKGKKNHPLAAPWNSIRSTAALTGRTTAFAGSTGGTGGSITDDPRKHCGGLQGRHT
jgi:hypothetical protein